MQTFFREQADLFTLPISSSCGLIPLHFSGWLEHLFLLLQKLFVCLNNYALMFLILFLKSPESRYPDSGPSRFWIFRNSIWWSVESWCIHWVTVSSPLTFRKSCTRGSTQLICNLQEKQVCVARRVCAAVFGSSVRVGGIEEIGRGGGGGGPTERNVCSVVKIMTVWAHRR